MNLPAAIGAQPINKVIADHPQIGAILNKHDIGCVTCGVVICLVNDVVSIHALGAEVEQKIEREINTYLTNKGV